jgi:hypothetical protein
MPMTICAWCPKFGRIPKFLGGDPKSKETSHGMCDECHQEIVEQERSRIKRACEASA